MCFTIPEVMDQNVFDTQSSTSVLVFSMQHNAAPSPGHRST